MREKIGRRGFRLETETAEGHEWHENMRARPAIASLQPASFLPWNIAGIANGICRQPTSLDLFP